MNPADSAAPFTQILQDYLLPMQPRKTVSRFLAASQHPDTPGPVLAGILEDNPLYAHYLQKIDILQEKVKKWKEEMPEDHSTARLTQFITVLLGPDSTRNAVLAIWLGRHSAAGLPRKPGDPFLLLPRRPLKFATAAGDFCEENRISEKTLAQIAALSFDWLALLIEKKGGQAKAELAYLDELWPAALKSGRIAHELAAVAGKLELSPYAFGAALQIELGRVLMALSFPKNPLGEGGYKNFLKHCDSHGARSRLAQQVLESLKFPFTHAEAASLGASVIPLLSPAEKSIQFYLEPYLLRQTDPASFALGALLSAALTLARNRPEEPLSAAQLGWLQELGIDETGLGRVRDRIGGKN